jgi:NADP-dependent 3-hydroxy acid dehydrogenase YdfG
MTTIEENPLEFDDIDILSNNGGHFSSVSIVTNLNSNICTALTRQNATGNNCIF